MISKRIKHQIFAVWIAAWLDLFDALAVILTFGIYKGFGLGLYFRIWCVKKQLADNGGR